MKIELAPEIHEYAEHFAEMLRLRSGMRPTKEEAITAFINSLAATGDLIVERVGSSVRVSARSFDED